ncbi:MAG: protein kinase, partial [Acidobacteriota bacterium]
MESSTTDRLHRYSTAIPLSAGGMAEVFTAYDPQVGRDVALKFPRSDDPEHLRLILEEARLLAQVDHPNVCRIYDVGELEGRPYLALELIDGEPLDEICDVLDLRTRVALVADIADAVHAAHRAGILHRDLKPDNILVARTASDDLRPVVVDFGLARFRGAERGAAIGGLLSGTPPYLAPELIRHPDRPADRRGDVYALGAILYRVITGTPVFQGDSHVELLRRTLEDSPRRPRSLVPGMARTLGNLDLEDIILGCLDKDPHRRYPTPRALSQELRRVLDGKPIHRRSPSTLQNLVRRTGLRRPMVLALAAAIVSLVVGLTLWRSSVHQRHAERYAEQARALSWHMRMERMRAPHDLGRAKHQIAREIDLLIDELPALPRAAHGPAHAAIGHGQLAIDRRDAALDHLEQAWALGHRRPDVAYDLALARSHRYAEALDQARAEFDPALQRAAVETAHQHHRQPLLDALDAARGAPSVPVGYIEALLALHTERFDAALIAAERAQQRAPWLHETDLLRGQVLLRQGESFTVQAAFAEAETVYAAATAAFEQALTRAASEPKAYVGLCAVERARLRLSVQRGDLDALDARRHAAETHCSAAIALDDQPAKPYLMDAETAILWAAQRYSRGSFDVRGDALDRALLQLDHAAARAPDNPRIAWLRGDALFQRSRLISWWRREGDPRPWIDLAVQSHRRALLQLPDHPLLLARIGASYSAKALYATFAGTEPSLAVRLGNDAMRRVIAVHSDVLAVHRALAGLNGTDALYRVQHGREFLDAVQRSIHHHRRALALAPDDAEGYVSLALVIGLHTMHQFYNGLNHSTQVQESIALIERAMQLHPNEAEYADDMLQVLLNASRSAIVRGKDPTALLDRGRAMLGRIRAHPDVQDPIATHMRSLDLETLSLKWLLHERRLDPDAPIDVAVALILPRARAHHAAVAAVTTNFFVTRAVVDFELLDVQLQRLGARDAADVTTTLDAVDARIARHLALRPEDARMLVRRGIAARLRADALADAP